jgi:ketosteroid isomerase-like protein
MFKGPLEDRIAISELHQTYADAVVRADAADWGRTWTEDAHWNLMGMDVDGREAIVALWQQAMSGLDAVSFHCIPSMTVVDGDRARGRCQTQEYMKVKDGTTRAIGGLYEDEMIKRDGQWYYTSRIFRVIAEYNPPKG